MKVEYSKAFVKAVKKQSGKQLQSIKRMIEEVKEATSVEQITDCLKMSGFEHVYRIKIGSQRAFFVLIIDPETDTVIFQYLVSRGEAYKKYFQEQLKRVD